jgi:hypothetical protein
LAGENRPLRPLKWTGDVFSALWDSFTIHPIITYCRYKIYPGRDSKTGKKLKAATAAFNYSGNDYEIKNL